MTSRNVGRVAERIVANELEYRGFRVSDLNKDGLAPNADLIAAKGGKVWQVQVKGASCTEPAWWFKYGHCQQEHIDDPQRRFYNSVSSHYTADYVVLAAVKTPSEYLCVVLPIDEAERVVQLSLDHDFRPQKKDGSQHKPGRMWGYLEYMSKKANGARKSLIFEEQAVLQRHLNSWSSVGA